MIRLHVVVEGATEETFVREVLYPHLQPGGVYPLARRLGKPGHKGGNVSFERVRRDVLLLLKQDESSACTTFFDFYGRRGGFPECSQSLGTEAKAQAIEEGLRTAIMEAMGASFREDRFIPYIQMHEFEGLLFSDPERMASGFGTPELREELEAIRTSFDTPEDINDGVQTAPSKRIARLIPGYSKVIGANLAALEVGLDTIRQECPRFDAWVRRLEALRGSSSLGS